MVFQQFNLFPHLTILENLMLGPVRARKMAEADARDLAMHYLERVRFPNNSVNIQRNYRAASSNVWRLHGRFAWRQRSCFLTNQHRRLIQK
jgi:ABC-type histidine transport system ATPase subunit